jgi:hypothetical protein
MLIKDIEPLTMCMLLNVWFKVVIQEEYFVITGFHSLYILLKHLFLLDLTLANGHQRS